MFPEDIRVRGRDVYVNGISSGGPCRDSRLPRFTFERAADRRGSLNERDRLVTRAGRVARADLRVAVSGRRRRSGAHRNDAVRRVCVCLVKRRHSLSEMLPCRRANLRRAVNVIRDIDADAVDQALRIGIVTRWIN